MWQWINATRHKRRQRLFTLPFVYVRTKQKSICAYDKMKLLLAVSVCTPQLTQTEHKRMKRPNYGHTCDFSPCVCKCIHELDRPSSFSCWIKAKSFTLAHLLVRTNHVLYAFDKYITTVAVLWEQIVLALLLHTYINKIKPFILLHANNAFTQIDASQ